MKKDKILKVENAEKSLANLLMAMNIVFAYDYGTFYIFHTHDPKKFYDFCEKYGVRESELRAMVITETENEF